MLFGANSGAKKRRANEYADVNLGTQLTSDLMSLLRLRGTHGEELTRHKWESGHYALRVLLKMVDPASDLTAKMPTAPKPKGLDKFFKN